MRVAMTHILHVALRRHMTETLGRSSGHTWCSWSAWSGWGLARSRSKRSRPYKNAEGGHLSDFRILISQKSKKSRIVVWKLCIKGEQI